MGYNISMNESIVKKLREDVSELHLPRYSELPQIGLYLEQTSKYINRLLSPIGCAEITTSMISNYVKKGFIDSPHKKQYDADKIAYLIFIAITKNVLSMDYIDALFHMQKKLYSLPRAYDYFCEELENMLKYVYGLKATPDEVPAEHTVEQRLLRDVIISASHSLYLSAFFSELKKPSET